MAQYLQVTSKDGCISREWPFLAQNVEYQLIASGITIRFLDMVSAAFYSFSWTPERTAGKNSIGCIFQQLVFMHKVNVS